jgi:FkbM family methyltransferase
MSRRRRKYSLLHYVFSITREIWQHPNVRRHRARALLRGVAWQLYRRLVRKPITIRVFDGMQLRCYPQSASASAVIYFGEYFEFHEMNFVRALLEPGDGFIDGGANIGVYSLLSASMVGSGGWVDAFEPDPLAAERLRENVALNQLTNVVVHEAAITDAPGQVRFTEGWDVSNRVLSQNQPAQNVVEVDAVRLDDALQPGVRYMIGKLDLEGAELAALRGAPHHLRSANPPVWMFEGFEHQLAKLGDSRQALLSMLSASNFTFHVFDALRHELMELDDPLEGPQNLIAVHRSARELVRGRLGK